MNNHGELAVLDIGGSIIAPDSPDTSFLKDFLAFIQKWLEDDSSQRLIMVTGGGGAARAWQEAVSEIAPRTPSDSLDWVGVMATRLNAELMRSILGSLCLDPVVTDPTSDFQFTGRVLIAAGWKPGFSTDCDAVILAERFSVQRVVMLSNIPHVYDSDPQNNPQAKPLIRLTWEEYKSMIQDKWTPGSSMPFDPVAAKKAAEIGLTVIAADGRNLNNLQAIIAGKEFVGTEIVPR